MLGRLRVPTDARYEGITLFIHKIRKQDVDHRLGQERTYLQILEKARHSQNLDHDIASNEINKYLFSSYSLAISCLIWVLASSRLPAFTAAKLKKITGYVPCSFRYVSFCQIESPSNRSARFAYLLEKKQSSILIFNVLPKRLGRVINVTTSRFSHHSFIKFVLSTKNNLALSKQKIPVFLY